MSQRFNLRPSPAYDVPAGRTALIVTDMQRASFDATLGLAALHAATHGESFTSYQRYVRETLIPNNAALLARFRALGWRVVYLTCGSHLPDGGDLGAPRRRADIEQQKRTGKKTLFSIGEHAHGVIDELTPSPGEPIFNKLGSDGFIGTPLDQMLRWMGIDTLIVTGVGTPYCVESTVRHASDLAYAVIVPSDACGTSDMTLHEHSLVVMASRYAMVRTTAEILARMPAAAAAADPAAGRA